jgi:hypothetical protein
MTGSNEESTDRDATHRTHTLAITDLVDATRNKAKHSEIKRTEKMPLVVCRVTKTMRAQLLSLLDGIL